MKKLSIVVPCYNEEDVLPLFYNELEKETIKITNYEFEYIFVDDGSKDNTLSILKELAKKDQKIKYYSFSRNFGKEGAMYCGMEKSTGDLVCIMDADLQDPPALLHEMLLEIENKNYDSIATRRVTRKGEPKIRSFFARMFYKMINKNIKFEIVDGSRDYRLMKRKMVDSILSLKETTRFTKGLFGWVGYNTKWLEYENIERAAGQTKWNFWSLLAYSMEGFVAFSLNPLKLAFKTSIFFLCSGFIGMILCFIFGYINTPMLLSWPLTLAFIFISLAIILLFIGIIGLYIGRTSIEVRNRPIYIVNEDNSNK